MFDLEKLIRGNISSLIPYSTARDEYKGNDAVFLDANENPYNPPYSRYPDPQQLTLKKKIAAIKGTDINNIFLGNGSDEPIDLVYRAFCEPAIDNVIAIEPTYGMYVVCAGINNVQYKKVLLDDTFQLHADQLLKQVDDHTKLIFLCSPNNPTSNLLNEGEIIKVIQHFSGIVIVDEAYIDFTGTKGFLPHLGEFPNLIILQTFSKAWGLASLRLGMAFALPQIIDVLNKIKYPYNINFFTQQFVLEQLELLHQKEQWVELILQQRQWLHRELQKVPVVKNILPSDANFLMVKVTDAHKVYDYLISKKIIVRNRSKVSLCLGYLRITIGTKQENRLLVEELKKYEPPKI